MFREKRTLLFEPDKLMGQIIRVTKVDFREDEHKSAQDLDEAVRIGEEDVRIGFVVSCNTTFVEFLYRVRQLKNEFRYEGEEDENFVPEAYMYEVVTNRGTLNAEEVLHAINKENSLRNVYWQLEVVDVK